MSKDHNQHNLEYPVRIEFDREDEVFVAEVTDFPGCVAYGESPDEAYKNVLEAKSDWIKDAKERGLAIPSPSMRDEHSGRILLRLPTSLHGMLVDRAALKGSSLNQYIVHLLSAGVVGDSVEDSINQLRLDLNVTEKRILNRISGFPQREMHQSRYFDNNQYAFALENNVNLGDAA